MTEPPGGLYDPLPEEPSDETTLQCAGCNERVSASEYPPGVPCPRCRSTRRRMADGSILPRFSSIWILVIVDVIITAIIVLALLYYFVFRKPESPSPPPAVEPTPVTRAMPPSGLEDEAIPSHAPEEPEPLSIETADVAAPPTEPAVPPVVDQDIETPAPDSAPQPPEIERPRANDDSSLTFLEELPEIELAQTEEIVDDTGIPTIRGYGNATGQPSEVVREGSYLSRVDETEPPEIPTITGEAYDDNDEDYVPFEFVQPEAQPYRPSLETVTSAPISDEWQAQVLVAADTHDDFSGRGLNQGFWQTTFHESPDPCQAYFMLSRSQLLVGANEARPQGPATVLWAHDLVGDFQAELDFRWLLPPSDGQCGIYIECLNESGDVEAFIDVSAWGAEADARRIIFRSGRTGADTVKSADCPDAGRLRIARDGATCSAALWNGEWIAIGSGPIGSGPARIRISGYSSASCPKFALSLDDFEMRNRRTATLAFHAAVDPTRQAALEPETDTTPNTSSAEVTTLPPPVHMRPDVVSIKESRSSSGKPGPLPTTLPYAMAALPTGPIVADIQNRSTGDIVVGLRSEEQGLDLRLPAGGSSRAMLPEGDYRIVMRSLSNPSHLLATDSFAIPPSATAVSLELQTP